MTEKKKKPRHDNTSREVHNRWDKAHLTPLMLAFNNEKDADILAAYDSLKRQGYKTSDAVKHLLRYGLK